MCPAQGWLQMMQDHGEKVRSAIAGVHAGRIFIFVPIFLLTIAYGFKKNDFWPFFLIGFPAIFYTVYNLYADYNGGIWWNNDKIWKRKKEYRWFRPTLVEAELAFADLTLVEREVYIPQGDTKVTDIEDYIALYGPAEGAPPVIKLGFQYHMKRDLITLMETLNSRYPEKCSDAIRAYINS
jgi:hypothetical protein